MEPRKRKRTADDLGDGCQTRSGGGEDDREVTDDEVEEFFAIVRRMNDLSRCLAAADVGGGTGRVRTAKEGQRVAVQWSPAFAWEDFAGSDASKDDRRKGRSIAVAAEVEERVAENATTRFLDLNAEPEPEPEGLVVGSPRGESTASRRAPAPAKLFGSTPSHI